MEGWKDTASEESSTLGWAAYLRPVGSESPVLCSLDARAPEPASDHSAASCGPLSMSEPTLILRDSSWAEDSIKRLALVYSCPGFRFQRV